MHPLSRVLIRQCTGEKVAPRFGLDKTNQPARQLQQMASRAHIVSTTLEPVVISVEACRKLAPLLRSHTIPADREDGSLPGLKPNYTSHF